VNLAQNHSAILEILESQTKEELADRAKNRTLLACGKYKCSHSRIQANTGILKLLGITKLIQTTDFMQLLLTYTDFILFTV